MKKFRSIAKSIKNFFNPLTWFDTVPISKEIPAPKKIKKTTLKVERIDPISEKLPKPIDAPLINTSLYPNETLIFLDNLYNCEEYRERRHLI